METSLITCADCGRALSRRATRCPHCEAEQLDCWFCEARIPTSELFKPGSSYAVHKRCLVPHFDIPESAVCPDCFTHLSATTLQTTLRRFTTSIKDLSCPSCGSPHPLQDHYICTLCKLPILELFQKRFTGPLIEYFDTHYTNEYHDFCVPHDSPLRPPTKPQRRTGCLSLALLLCVFTVLCHFMLKL